MDNEPALERVAPRLRPVVVIPDDITTEELIARIAENTRLLRSGGIA